MQVVQCSSAQKHVFTTRAFCTHTGSLGVHSVRHHAGLQQGYPPLFDWIYDCGSPFPISTDWLGANLSHQTPTEDKGGCGRRPVLKWNKFVMAATVYIFCIKQYSRWEAFQMVCSKWLSSAVAPLNQTWWRAFCDIFPLLYLHWVITPSGYFFSLPLLIPPYLNVYSFPLEAETQSGADQPITLLAMFVWGWGVVDFGHNMHAIYHPREFRWLADSRSLLAAQNRKWNQWLGQHDLIAA